MITRGVVKSSGSQTKLRAVVRDLNRRVELEKVRAALRAEQEALGATACEIDDTLVQLRMWREAALARMR